MSLVPFSLLDLATVGDTGVGPALAACVAAAQTAEASGYRRVWYAEHHNMPAIASSATAVLIAHVAAHTSKIRVGSGGVMLPNHSPLVIAEQFGTLAELHPGRIDLGLGRAPGGDGATFRSLRRSPQASENFPHDVLELQRLLSNELPRNAVNAYPGRGTNIPLTILGSSMFGASLAAQLGLPYAFASHFAPQHLRAAVSHYREAYRPSDAHPAPYVYAAINVVAADTDEAAEELYEIAKIERVRRFLSMGHDRDLTTLEAESLLDTPAGQSILAMLTHRAVGGPERVSEQLANFAQYADADELMTVHVASGINDRLVSIRLAAGHNE
jgi:luciferase family oxidoreductase group 1